MEPIKVSVASLPNAKEGDMIQMRVTGTDPTTDMLMLEPVMDHAMQEPDSVEGEPDGEHEAESGEPSMDTKTLLGPMDGLKNYLVQKSQDVPKNQGR